MPSSPDRFLHPALAGLHVRTGNLHGELLSVHKISQAYPGAPTTGSGRRMRLGYHRRQGPRMHRSQLWYLFALFVTATPLCWGQDRGAIIGRVTDPSSAVVSGATVTVTNQETGVKSTTTTNDDGNYAVRSIPFGK